MNDSEKQMDYNGLILMHLSRISAVTTSNFIENVNPSLQEVYVDPPKAGEIALDWGVEYLYSIIPDDLQDQAFKEEKIASEDGVKRKFNKLKKMINLLYRKGLLIQNKQIGGFDSKSKKNVNKEEWEE